MKYNNFVVFFVGFGFLFWFMEAKCDYNPFPEQRVVPTPRQQVASLPNTLKGMVNGGSTFVRVLTSNVMGKDIVVVMDYSKEAGELRISNQIMHPLTLEVVGGEVTLEPGQEAILPVAPSKDPGAFILITETCHHNGRSQQEKFFPATESSSVVEAW